MCRFFFIVIDFCLFLLFFFFFQAEDGIRDTSVTGVQTCALPIFTLLFLDRSPAASLGGLSWAPDPEHGRLLAFDRELRVVRQITNPRLATPMAVTPLGGTELLVTEHTGEGVVVDTMGDGHVVREWESPDVASLYAAGAGRVAATRS